MIDCHVHLHDPAYEADRPAVLERARAAGVQAMITVGTDVVTSAAAVALAESQPDVFAAVGIHPDEASGRTIPAQEIDQIRKLATSPRVVVIGEVGFDLYRTAETEREAVLARQRALFQAMRHIAEEVQKPLMLHLRPKANDDAYLIALEELVDTTVPVIAHCFSGSRQTRDHFLAKNIDLSFASNITYARATDLLEAGEEVFQKEWFGQTGRGFLLETDGPYLAPQSRRGKRNEPAFLAETLQFVADRLQISTQELDRLTTAKAKAFFQLDLGSLNELVQG